MKYSYYPGCTLKNKAKALDDYARACALTLGFELEELDTWQCCGGYISLKEKALSGRLCSRIAGSAADFGAECLVTACPLCKYNLSRESSLPVVYFTELLAEALGIMEVDA